MAARGKKPAAPRAVVHKNHGPKRHLFHDIQPKGTRMMMESLGLCDKYHHFDSFVLALQARGVKRDYEAQWQRFCLLGGDRAKQDQFFDSVNCRSR